jgi:DNA polymerase
MGIPVPKRWKDTLAACAYRGIPLSLDKAGAALELSIQKNKRGKYLLNTLSVPKWGTAKEPDRIYREDPELLEELYEYCLDDIDSEGCLGDVIGELPPAEYNLWCLDQRINQRGVRLDLDAVEEALILTDKIAKSLNIELRKITQNAVEKATQRNRLLEWLRKRDLPHLTDLRKETLEELLAKDKYGKYVRVRDLSPETIRALEIRAQLSKSSTKKLEKMIDTVSSDGRVRGLLQYHGAGTGRWAGRLVQPQNFPRATITNAENAKGKKYLDMELLLSHIKNNEVMENYENPMEAVASSLRGMFISDEDKVLRICDFSAIEARVTFWVAGCQIGLDVFHKSDRGESEDIYCVTASDLVGYEVKKSTETGERQLGKITVLGCGYQMGPDKLQFQAETSYNVILTEDEARNMVSVYREKYKEVKWLWYGLNDAAIATVRTGQPHSYKKILYKLEEDRAGRWLACVLPNGRKLWYYDPNVETVDTPWGRKPNLTYMGRDNKRGGTWGRIRTYGGMLTENVVQAIARDLMAEAMIRVEEAGYPIILTVHDEIISEVAKDYGSQKEFESLMSEVPVWAEGCPIEVEGGSVTRYQKV